MKNRRHDIEESGKYERIIQYYALIRENIYLKQLYYN